MQHRDLFRLPARDREALALEVQEPRQDLPERFFNPVEFRDRFRGIGPFQKEAAFLEDAVDLAFELVGKLLEGGREIQVFIPGPGLGPGRLLRLQILSKAFQLPSERQLRLFNLILGLRRLPILLQELIEFRFGFRGDLGRGDLRDLGGFGTIFLDDRLDGAVDELLNLLPRKDVNVTLSGPDQLIHAHARRGLADHPRDV
jgi:hypothetical protein